MRLLVIRETLSAFAPSLGNGAGIIATVAHRAGHDVRVIDNNSHYRFYKARDFIRIVESFRPDVIGFSISMLNAYFSYALLSALKKSFPEVFYIAGGIHMKHSSREALEHGFDIVVNHEGELVILPVLDHLKDRSRIDFRKNLDSVEGISFVTEDGFVHRSESYPRIDNIDDIPFVNYDLFNLEDYFKTGKEPGVISLCCQRGCPYRCTFCSDEFLRKDTRASSAEYLYRYVEYIHSRYGRKIIILNDNNFAYPRERAVEFCNRIISSPLKGKVQFSVQTKIETVHDEELLKLFKEAGVVSFALGIERMDTLSKKLIHKTTSNDRVYSTLDLITRAGMPVRINGILGFPFETEEILESEQKAFVGFQEKYKSKVSLSILMPQPGTVYYDNCPKAREWYLNPEILSIWRAYYSSALDVSSLYHADQNYFNLDKQLIRKIKQIFMEFKNREHAYYLPQGILPRTAIFLDRLLVSLSMLLCRISPGLEFGFFTRVKFMRYYLGSLLFGDRVFER